MPLPLKQIINMRTTYNSTCEIDQYLQHPVPKLSTNYITPHSYTKLYGLSNTQHPKNIATVCIYKCRSTITVQPNKEYDLDNYLRSYVSQHLSFTKYIKQEKISKLPPPRTSTIHIITLKISDTSNTESYNFPQYYNH